MTCHYGQPILVTLADGRPASFQWREVTYRVAEILSEWHLRDRWWEPPASVRSVEIGGPQASDRHYYRVQCASGLLCDLYYDAAVDCWVLDRVYD